MKVTFLMEILTSLSRTMTRQLMVINKIDQRLPYDGDNIGIIDDLDDVHTAIDNAIEAAECLISSLDTMLEEGVEELEEENDD